MDSGLILAVLFRWMHIFAALLAAGGVFYMRLALVPAAGKVLSDDQHNALRSELRAQWAKWVHLSIAFLLVSGLYNMAMIEMSKQLPKELAMPYRGVFTVKFVLGLAIFFIATKLVGRSASAERFRQNARYWLTVNMGLIIVLVCLSGVLRVMRDQQIPKPAASRATQTAAAELDGHTRGEQVESQVQQTAWASTGR